MDPNAELELLEQEAEELQLDSDQDSSDESESESSNQAPASSAISRRKGKSVLVEFDPASSSKPVPTNKPSCAFLGDMNAKYQDQEFVFLKCQDGETVPVPVQQAVQSSYVRHQLESGIEDNVVLCPYLSVPVLEMLMEYWSAHVGEEFFDEEKAQEIDEWEEEFFKRIGPDNMFDLFVGANYIDAWGCIDRGADFCAEFIRYHKIHEIREYFNLKNDFTPEEEARLKVEFPWAFEDDD